MIALSSTANRLRVTGLALSAYAEAFCLAPRSFLIASMWWLLRKRARARGQFASIIGRTSRAYDWSCLQHEAAKRPSSSVTPPLVALVGVGPCGESLDRTLQSLDAEGLSAYLVGPDVRASLIRATEAIDWSSSPWLLPIAAGDLLAAGAADTYREAIRSCTQQVVYSDDDFVDPHGFRRFPHFKPSWNAELYRYHDYLTGACIVKVGRAELRAAAAAGDAWASALITAAVASGSGATNIAEVLHHRQNRPRPCFTLPRPALVDDLPRVTVIVPTRNRVDLLATCIAGLEATDYPDVEVIVVDNDSVDAATLAFLDDLPSRDKVGFRIWSLHHPGPFNYSRINNRAVAAARGDLVCLLNNDIEMLSPDWLSVMATQALRDEVGAVGAQLLYPDGRIQHAGVVIGVGNAAGHAHRFLRPEEPGYFRRHALPQFVSAVTAACLVVRRDRFLAVGGLDEERFPVAFNDVDLCLRLNERGWQSFYEPRAVLVHHESVSRGLDRDTEGAARFAKELEALQNRWRTMEVYDPYHHPRLSRASEQFALAL